MRPDVVGRKTVFTLYLLTLASMMSGYLREMSLATTFGAGSLTDSYLSVITIIRLVCDTIPSAMLLATIIPSVSSLLDRPERVRAHVLTVTVLTTAIMTLGLALLIWGCMPFLLPLLTPGFDPERLGIARSMTSAIVWFMPIHCTGMALTLFLNAHGRFRIAAATPLISNGVFILSLALTPDWDAVSRLWLATLSGPTLTVLLLGRQVIRQKLFYYAPSPEASVALRQIRITAWPVLFSLGLTSSIGLLMICQLMIRGYGSMMEGGTIAALSFAFRLYEVPVSMTANIAATLSLPILSRYYANGQQQDFTRVCRDLLEWGLLLLTPVAVFTALEAPSLVRILLAHGNFTSEDASQTAAALTGFAPAIVFEAGLVVFYRAFYAAHRTRAAMGVSLIVIATLGLLLTLIPIHTIQGLSLAFSTSLAIGMMSVLFLLTHQTGCKITPNLPSIITMIPLFFIAHIISILPERPPLVGGLGFMLLYSSAFLILFPKYRKSLIQQITFRKNAAQKMGSD
ncbi:lipid II flippase MurJ [Novispirillum itersonii]|uniref:lipid II flippase MurJ n=1 Tax=Novispirillum itersonii TaxID=189 RepID=UPI00035DBD7C|nr:lipid II flippase MurJ [Novispirillum itersonii]